MRETLSQYFQRSPRYILLPHDEYFIRVAGPKQTPWEEGTEIRNVSLTGLSFTAPDILLPNQGELVRVEFTPPTSKAMACYARVVRIENAGKEISLVAIEFEGLNVAQQKNLELGLKDRLAPETKNKGDVIEVNQISLEGPSWLTFLFYVSVGLSLFFAAFILFSVFRLLVDPFWFEKIILVLQSLWVSLAS